MSSSTNTIGDKLNPTGVVMVEDVEVSDDDGEGEEEQEQEQEDKNEFLFVVTFFEHSLTGMTTISWTSLLISREMHLVPTTHLFPTPSI